LAKSSKGSAFERKVCSQLSLWWSDGEDDDIFYRTAGSGARATARSKRGKKTENSYGDVGYTKPEGKPLIDLLLLELKRGYTTQISALDFVDQLVKRKPPILKQWWDKAEAERKEAGRKYTVIIFRRDSHQACIFMSPELFSTLCNYCNLMKASIITIDLKYVLDGMRNLAIVSPLIGPTMGLYIDGVLKDENHNLSERGVCFVVIVILF